MEFVKFPHTPHIIWLGRELQRNDKVMTQQERTQLLEGEVHVEEKIDGANIGLSLDTDGRIRAQNRGAVLERPFEGQYRPLTRWLSNHEDLIFDLLTTSAEGTILFGEWCAAKHTVPYDQLPDLWILFDVFDTGKQKFWSSVRRDTLASTSGLSSPRRIADGRFQLSELVQLAERTQSQFGSTVVEGIVVRKDGRDWLESKGKIVRPEFTQAITTHWSSRSIVWNRSKPEGA